MALDLPRERWPPGLYIGTTDVLTRPVLPPAGRCPDAEGGCLEEDERRGNKIQNLSLVDGPRGDPPEDVWPNPLSGLRKMGASPGPAVVGGVSGKAP